MRGIRALSTLCAAAMLIVGCVNTNPGPTPEPTIDPSIIAALAPACTGQPVTGAGSMITDGSALNHIVVLDAQGVPFAWTDWTPNEWRPANTADLELVACAQTEPILDQVQICPYYGAEITRYRVTHAVSVVEPSTGRVMGTFDITAEPRGCKAQEYASTTEIRGEVDANLVKGYLAGFVEQGKYVAPSSSPPSPSDASSAVPSSTGASSIPTGSAQTVELRQALAAGQVTASGTGDGLESLDLDLTSTIDRRLEVTIEAGTLLEPQAKGTQIMMVVSGDTVVLAPRTTESVTLDVNCVQMHQDQPTGDDTFTVTTDIPDSDLRLLLVEPTLADATGRVRQFAVWTITNDPKRGDYVPLGSTFEVFGTGPDDEEISQIRSLFLAAGIDTTKSRALR